ncbi:MAG TPA: YsnF/AvaK domain-containing protein [Acidobacteriaceae bacterium]|nr:YsnF/AvaK domain-containing protein [Acidobacteriaceae bacterium]
MLRSNVDFEAVVIGIFPLASDARRALQALREQQFSADEVAAAFREQSPAPVETEEAPGPVRANRDWFGQLRQLYHGDDRLESTRRGATAPLAPPATPTSFEAMLVQLDLSSQETRTLDHAAAIVTVTAGARNPEARTLLEQRGARIVNRRKPEQPAIAEATPGTVVTSTPLVAPPPADPGHIQLFGEVLRVRKEKVANEEVHVRKESVTQMETVQVPVTREHLVVEHSDESGRTNPEGSIRVPLSEERVHIDKDTVLREEYKVGKREVTQNESVSDRVRRERLLIDDAPDDASAKSGDRRSIG